MMKSKYKYKVFISYSQSADSLLAESIQSGLRSLAKPWYKLESIRVFRDVTDLSATPELWPTIENALSDSEYLVLLASPAASKSKWVKKEIEYWQSNKQNEIKRRRETLLIAQTQGSIAWNENTNDFDWTTTTSLPNTLSRFYNYEPLYADFSKFDTGGLVSDERFLKEIAKLASPIRGLSPGELIGKHEKAHRTLLRIRNTVVLAILLLTCLLAYFLWRSSVRNEANSIAMKGIKYEAIDPTQSYQQILQGYKRSNDSTLFEIAANVYSKNYIYEKHFKVKKIVKSSFNGRDFVCLSDSGHMVFVANNEVKYRANLSSYYTDEVEQLQLNRNGDHFIFKAARKDSIYLFDKSGKLVRKFHALLGRFSYTSSDLLIVSKTGELARFSHEWNYDSNHTETTKIDLRLQKFNPSETDLSILFSANDSLMSIGKDSIYSFFNVISGKCTARITLKHPAIAISRSGEYIATGDGLQIIVYRFGKYFHTVTANTDNISSIEFSPIVENVLFFSSVDKYVYIYDVGNYNSSSRLIAHLSEPDFSIAPTGQSILTYDRSNVFIWRVVGYPIKVYADNSESEFNSVKIAPITKHIAAANMNGYFFAWDSAGTLLFQDSISSHFNKNRITFTANGEKLFYISKNLRKVVDIDLRSKNSLLEFESTTENIQCISIANQDYLIGISDMGSYYLWSANGKLLLQRKILRENTSILALKTNGNKFLTGDDNGNAFLFDSEGNVLDSLKYDDDSNIVQSADISNDEFHVALAGNTGQIRLLNKMSGEYLPQPFSPTRLGYVMDLSFLNRSKAIITCGNDQTFKIWDYNGRLVSSITTNTSYMIWDIDISNDETNLVTADDKSIKLWLIKEPVDSKKAIKIIDLN